MGFSSTLSFMKYERKTESPRGQIMTPAFNEMAEAATAFCNLIEKVEIADAGWLKEMSALLPIRDIIQVSMRC